MRMIWYVAAADRACDSLDECSETDGSRCVFGTIRWLENGVSGVHTRMFDLYHILSCFNIGPTRYQDSV